MKKPKKPWRRGQRLGPGLIDLSEGALPKPKYSRSCCLCDASDTVSGVKTLPGVGRYHDYAICAACLAERGTGAYCAGCDKPLVPYTEAAAQEGLPDGSGWQAELEVGGEFTVYVCAGDLDSWIYETSPGTQCKRKARRALALCPGGCGEAAEPGELCDDCAGTLDLSRRMSKADKQEELCYHSARVPRELAEIIAQAVSGRGAGTGHAESYGKIEVHVTPSQADALDRLAEAFEAYGKQKHEEGFKEGNSFLRRLAAGDISMSELNKRSAEGKP